MVVFSRACTTVTSLSVPYPEDISSGTLWSFRVASLLISCMHTSPWSLTRFLRYPTQISPHAFLTESMWVLVGAAGTWTVWTLLLSPGETVFLFVSTVVSSSAPLVSHWVHLLGSRSLNSLAEDVDWSYIYVPQDGGTPWLACKDSFHWIPSAFSIGSPLGPSQGQLHPTTCWSRVYRVRPLLHFNSILMGNLHSKPLLKLKEFSFLKGIGSQNFHNKLHE